MRINHNIAALNTHRQMGEANKGQQNSMEKLSSGLRINKAGDDAAGLAISEKMRGQIRGLDQASRNSQDGISMIQTAEGALNESHDILQRMRELATQSANDTNTDADRQEIQKEVDQLSEELSRIGDNTEFNTQNLLDGSFEGTFQIGANEGQNLSLEVNDMRGFELGMAGDAEFELEGTYAAGSGSETIVDGEYTVQENEDGEHDLINSDGEVAATSTDGGETFTGDDSETLTFTDGVTSGSVSVDTSGTSTGTASVANDGLEAGTYEIDKSNGVLMDSNGNTIAKDDGNGVYSNDGGDVLDISGSYADLADGDTVEIGGTDVSSQEAADSSITNINNAIESVSAERSKLGALQNRLDHTINNLGTSSENLTAAESRIRDVDMAEEMMSQTKNSILGQASQAMLAQANQQPQGVLQLLQ
ncbi:flagellin [Halobacillus andaensis]|uniref:Flagellin n=1 Tax=Halobacillus andaensis TaxID=1176239 RepID=A0A917B9D9_HALAA|nr:flagellin [Halobacillus andaensis]MBP2005416.1 flagellin [Halobacillus andaensis]GGF31306.1 flagellin [Halobacillus andaensis]